MPADNQQNRDPQLRSIAEAAELWAVSTKTIRRYIAAGKLTAHRLGPRLIRVDLNQLDRVMHPASPITCTAPAVIPPPARVEIPGGASFLTIDQAATRLELSHWTLRRLIANGKLPAHRRKGGRAIRLRLTDVDALLVPFPTGGDPNAAA